jgi:uncharacterized protein YbjT (DUF2867 family)
MNHNKTILVIGATGKQGGAVSRHLITNGYKVRAMVRNPESDKAKQLAKLHIETVKGDLEHIADIESAMSGDIYGVFSVQNYWGKRCGTEGELKQLKNLLTVAVNKRIQHFVQSSIPGAANGAENVLHVHSKKLQEDAVTASGLRYTFVSPVFFMENMFEIGKGFWPLVNRAWGQKDFKFHITAIDDIGGVTARVFNDPEKYAGKNIPVISDVLTIAEMRAVYEKVKGKKPASWGLPSWLIRLAIAELYRQSVWNKEGSWKDLSTRDTVQVYENITSFEAFLIKNKHRI